MSDNEVTQIILLRLVPLTSYLLPALSLELVPVVVIFHIFVLPDSTIPCLLFCRSCVVREFEIHEDAVQC